MEKACQEERIKLGHDLGFGEVVAASGARLPSVITFRCRNMHPDRVHGALQSILSQHGEAIERLRCCRLVADAANASGQHMTTPVRFASAHPEASRVEGSLLAYLPIMLRHDTHVLTVTELLDTGSTVNVLPYPLGLHLGFV